MVKIGGSVIPLNRSFSVSGGGPSDMPFCPRVAYLPERKRGKGVVLPHLVIRCGCCKEGPVEIYFDPASYAGGTRRLLARATLEINGVDGEHPGLACHPLPAPRLCQAGRDLG